MKKQSKRYKELLKSVVKDKKIELKEIIDLVKKNSTTKFDESIDVSLKINLTSCSNLLLLFSSVILKESLLSCINCFNKIIILSIS